MPRGRKKGDGVLRQLQPQNLNDMLDKLFFGKYAGNPFVRPLLTRLQIVAALAEKNYSKPVAADRARLVAQVDADFARDAMKAWANHDARWFRQVAEACNFFDEPEDLHPLHEAVLGMRTGSRPEYFRDNPFTLNEVCRILEETGRRPTGLSDESWQRTVRRACTEVGWKPATQNPRVKSNRQRFTPATLGLPSDYGTRSFWTRNDLLHQLHTAQAGYRALMLRVHPDKGGDAETFRQVKKLWCNVKNAFKRHGYKLT